MRTKMLACNALSLTLGLHLVVYFSLFLLLIWLSFLSLLYVMKIVLDRNKCIFLALLLVVK